MIASQMVHLDESIAKKKAIYEHYKEQLDETIMPINYINKGDEPNYNITGMICDSNICFEEARTDRHYVFSAAHGTASPMEIYEGLEAFNVESRSMYKPMHLQPVFRMYEQITLDGGIRQYEDFYQDNYSLRCDRSLWLFNSGICLPSDLRMTEEEQDIVVAIIGACFDKPDLNRLAWG